MPHPSSTPPSIYDEDAFIEWCVNEGDPERIQIILASDAHTPPLVGRILMRLPEPLLGPVLGGDSDLTKTFVLRPWIARNPALPPSVLGPLYRGAIAENDMAALHVLDDHGYTCPAEAIAALQAVATRGRSPDPDVLTLASWIAYESMFRPHDPAPELFESLESWSGFVVGRDSILSILRMPGVPPAVAHHFLEETKYDSTARVRYLDALIRNPAMATDPLVEEAVLECRHSARLFREYAKTCRPPVVRALFLRHLEVWPLASVASFLESLSSDNLAMLSHDDLRPLLEADNPDVRRTAILALGQVQREPQAEVPTPRRR